MGYFPVRYNSRVVNYDRRGFIRLATGYNSRVVNYNRRGFIILATVVVVVDVIKLLLEEI